MSGHSKWATIKHKKGAADKARGKQFAKLIKQVEVAARAGDCQVDGAQRAATLNIGGSTATTVSFVVTTAP